ncbi:MAG: ABC transporter substrate-binding protein, partial [Candidatus Methylomirabilales bacterium]
MGRRPGRIVSLAAQHTETLFALGRGASVVGVLGGETLPPEAMVLPRVIGEDPFAPEPSLVAGLGPDLILASGAKGAAWKEALRQEGFVVATLNAAGVEDALTDILTVGKLTGSLPEAERLTGRLRSQLDAIRQKVSEEPAPTVFLETGLAFPPLEGATGASFPGDVV